MTIQESLGAVGSWEIDLLPTIPREHLDALKFFGHIAIVHGRVDPATYGDSLLAKGVARYVGVLRGNSLADDARTNAPNDNIKISGVGMAMWLGDEDNKGAVIENATTFASGSLFPNVIRGLLPASGAVTEGTLYSVPGTYSGTHQWQSPAQAIQYVCDTMGTPSVPVAWRVNNDGTLDAGPHTDLFVTDPKCAVVARGGGEDMTLRGVPGSMNLTSDMKDYTTRVVLLAQGDGSSIATGSADLNIADNPYKDIHGNAVKLTRLVSESDTTAPNADVRAQLALAQYEGPNQDLQLSIQDYDIEGVFDLGDYIYAYDPDKGLVDTTQEIDFRGQRLNPITLQVVGIQWPVTADYTVAYRGSDGTWIDLTPHIEINAAGTYITVGDFSRQLTGASTEPIGSRPSQDTSVPGVPTLVEPFQGSAYLDSRGFTRARVVLTWNAPLNTDGSTVLDGDHYDIRYAIDTDQIYPATWTQVSQIRWEDMQTWAQPFAAPDTGWQTMAVGWDQGIAQLQDLSPGVGYDVQIRAVDLFGNVGDWSATTTFVATQDNIPPSTPAAPSVAASRIAVQVTHTLGKSSGGTFNLESDLDHLEIHGQYEPTFTPSDATLLGKLKANAGMIQAGIPAVATYNIESTSPVYVRVVAVDIAGNRSGPSDAASATALLIDDAHISDLTVSKVTAGTITASWVLAGEIKTADTGARFRASAAGIELYNAGGDRTLYGNAGDGSISMIGELRSSVGTAGALVLNEAGSTIPVIKFYNDTGSKYAFIQGREESGIPGPDAVLQLHSSSDASGNFGNVALRPIGARIGMSHTSGGFNYNNGGYLDTSLSQGEMGFQDELAGVLYGKFQAYSGGCRIVGKLAPTGSDDAVVMGISTPQTGTVFITNYGVTFPGTVSTLFSLASAGSCGGSWLSARAASNFTVTRELNTASCQASYWAWQQ